MGKLNVVRTLKGLAIAYLLEAAVLYFFFGVTIWAMVTGVATAPLTDSALALLVGGAAVWLTFAARAILKHKRWARSAGVFWQLIQLAIAFGTLEANAIVGTLIALASLAVLITLFQKDIVAATLENRS